MQESTELIILEYVFKFFEYVHASLDILWDWYMDWGRDWLHFKVNDDFCQTGGERMPFLVFTL